MKKGKKYLEAVKQYDKRKKYTVEEAVSILPRISISKFVGTVEMHIRLNLSESEIRQRVSTTFTLPHSFGKGKRVVVLCDDAESATAKEAGADHAGLDELVKKIQGGWLDFDVLIATPKVMPKIAMLGKALGPKGLMPNPKNGTVTTDIAKAVAEFKAGKISAKSDKQGIVHLSVAKLDAKPEDITENILFALKKVTDAAKKAPLTTLGSVSVSPTMGPSIRLSIEDLIAKI